MVVKKYLPSTTVKVTNIEEDNKVHITVEHSLDLRAQRR